MPGKQVDFTYHPRGLLASISRRRVQGGSSTLVTQATLSYNDAGLLTDLVHKNAAGAVQDRFQLSYDPGWRITSVVTTATGAGLGQFTTSFSYDKTDQLTAVGSPVRGEAYAYDDKNGNRRSSSSGTDSRNYNYPNGQHANRVRSDGKFNYFYDLEGNLVQKTALSGGETTFYTWDHRNRLVRVERRASSSPTSTLRMSAEYTYDVFDRRIAKRVDLDGAGSQPATCEGYVYDGPHSVLEFRDPDCAGAQPAVLATRRLYGPAVDQVLAEEQFSGGSSTVYWPLADWLGSVRDLVNDSGAVVKHIDYDAFGNVARVTNGSGQASTLDAGPSTRLLYTARDLDRETGLQYNRARYYDGAIGRWISEDPIRFAGGDTNLFRYVLNSPTHFVDPGGLKSEWHHLLPQSDEFREHFEEAGINIDDAEFGWIIDFEYHRAPGGNSLHPDWNKRWAKFFEFKRPGQRSAAEIRDQLERMKKDFDYLLSRGKQASMSYDEWNKWLARMRKAAEAARRAGKPQKIKIPGGRWFKPLGYVTFFYVASTEGVRAAANEAGRDLLWPYVDIAEAAASEVSPHLSEQLRKGALTQQDQGQRFLDMAEGIPGGCQLERLPVRPNELPPGGYRPKTE